MEKINFSLKQQGNLLYFYHKDPPTTLITVYGPTRKVKGHDRSYFAVYLHLKPQLFPSKTVFGCGRASSKHEIIELFRLIKYYLGSSSTRQPATRYKVAINWFVNNSMDLMWTTLSPLLIEFLRKFMKRNWIPRKRNSQKL